MFPALLCPSSGAHDYKVDSRELLMIGIAMPETCWVYNRYIKIISSINLVLILQLSHWCTVQYTSNCHHYFVWTPHNRPSFVYSRFFFDFGATAPSGPWYPHSRGFQITHNDTSQSVGFLWTSDQPEAETSTWQHTTLITDRHPCPGGIRTHNLSRRATADLRLRPRGHRDRLQGKLLPRNLMISRLTYPQKWKVACGWHNLCEKCVSLMFQEKIQTRRPK